MSRATVRVGSTTYRWCRRAAGSCALWTSVDDAMARLSALFAHVVYARSCPFGCMRSAVTVKVTRDLHPLPSLPSALLCLVARLALPSCPAFLIQLPRCSACGCQPLLLTHLAGVAEPMSTPLR